MIFDSHAHYDDDAFEADRREVLSSVREKGVETIVDIGASLESSRKAIALAEEYPYLYAAVGVHPSETKELNEETFTGLEKLAHHEKVRAIGEIGLDYHWEEPERAVQKFWFERQLKLAEKLDLPVVIHSRDAAADTLEIVKAAGGPAFSAVVHCFSYGVEMAREYLNMGHYLGIGGVCTFSNAKKIREVIAYMPLSSMLLETDCPYLAPVPNRGKRNDSGNLRFVLDEISRIRKVSREEVEQATYENAMKFYRLKGGR